jgi:hypothetical protein
MSQPRGIAFPFRFNDSGGVAESEGVAKVGDNLHHLTTSKVKERVIHKNVGTVAYDQVFRPNDDSTFDLVQALLREAYSTYERRALILGLDLRRTEDRDGMKTFIDTKFVFRETGQEDTVSVQVV